MHSNRITSVYFTSVPIVVSETNPLLVCFGRERQ